VVGWFKDGGTSNRANLNGKRAESEGWDDGPGNSGTGYGRDWYSNESKTPRVGKDRRDVGTQRKSIGF